MPFRVESEVNIVTEFDSSLDYGGVGIGPSMESYLGRTAIIRRVVTPNIYRIDIDGGEFNWHEDMFLESPIHNRTPEQIKEDKKTVIITLKYRNGIVQYVAIRKSLLSDVFTVPDAQKLSDEVRRKLAAHYR